MQLYRVQKQILPLYKSHRFFGKLLSADLLVDNKYIIEVDGVEDNKKSSVSNMKKQAILERCGFNVKRVTYREWQYSQNACLDRLLAD